MQKLKVVWRTQTHDLVGNAFGYGWMNKALKIWTEDLIEHDESADITLSLIPADHYEPVKDRFNVLFTMWEFLDLPLSYISALSKADLIIVPSRFCKEIFRRYTTTPIEVCWLGVNPEDFQYHKRSIPMMNYGDKFRFLWCGAPNPRKGYQHVLASVKIFEHTPNVEIYLKTTAQKIEWEKIEAKKDEYMNDPTLKETYENMLKHKGKDHEFKEVYGKNKNVIFDSRKLPFNELIDLYNSAHCFLLPNFGEGWGLTLCEAMATGCPCIATGATGEADFFNEQVGYPIKTYLKEAKLQNYTLDTKGYAPDIDHFLNLMFHVIRNYPEALRKGRKASDRIRTKFTWKQSGKRLTEILNKYARVTV